MTANVIVLPVIRVERYDEEGALEVVKTGIHPGVGPQLLRPSSDRRNIVELWRLRIEREQDEVCRKMRSARRALRRHEPDEPA